MRQYTTPEQTAKLIELGFEKPKSATTISWDMPEDDSPFINANSIEFEYQYSIGELIQMLPPTITSIKGRDNFLLIEHFYNEFRVRYGGRPDLLLITDEELVDALCRMIFMLKQYKLL